MAVSESGEYAIRLTVVAVVATGDSEQLEAEVAKCTSPALGPDRLVVLETRRGTAAGVRDADAVLLLDPAGGSWALDAGARLSRSAYPGVIGALCPAAPEEVVVAGHRAGLHVWESVPLVHAVFAARLRRLARRFVFDPPGDELSISLSASSRTLVAEGTRVRLTPREFAIVEYLWERCGHWVTQEELISAVFRTHHRHDTSVVRVHVSAIRAKLGKRLQWMLEGLERQGYRWVLRPDSTPARLGLPHLRYRPR